MAAVLDQPEAQVRSYSKTTPFGQVNINNIPNERRSWGPILANVAVNILADLRKQGLEVTSATFEQPLIGGVSAQTWLLEIQLNNGQVLKRVVKMVKDHGDFAYQRKALAFEIVAADLFHRRGLNHFPKNLGYRVLPEDMDEINEDLPENNITAAEPTAYFTDTQRVSYFVQSYVEGITLGNVINPKDFILGMVAYAQQQDLIREQTGVIAIDNKPDNVVVSVNEDATKVSAVPIDMGGSVYHKEYFPNPRNGIKGGSYIFPVENVNPDTVFAYARRNTLLMMIEYSFELTFGAMITEARKYNGTLAEEDVEFAEFYTQGDIDALIGVVNNGETLTEDGLAAVVVLKRSLVDYLLHHLADKRITEPHVMKRLGHLTQRSNAEDFANYVVDVLLSRGNEGPSLQDLTFMYYNKAHPKYAAHLRAFLKYDDTN